MGVISRQIIMSIMEADGSRARTWESETSPEAFSSKYEKLLWKVY